MTDPDVDVRTSSPAVREAIHRAVQAILALEAERDALAARVRELEAAAVTVPVQRQRKRAVAKASR